ncbi:MAG: NADH-quinone oxidoreductase subunit NuoK [Candidatus Dormiibacterota bacterium]
MTVGPGQFAVLSAAVFAVGIYGVLARRHPLGVAMSIGLLFAAPVIALVGFTHAMNGPPVSGDALAAFAIVVASCICSLGFALVLLLWRRTGRADIDALGDIEG